MLSKITVVLTIFFLCSCATTYVKPDSANQVPTSRLFLEDANTKNVITGPIAVTRDGGISGSGCRLTLYINNKRAADFRPKELARFNVPVGETLFKVGLPPDAAGLCGLAGGGYSKTLVSTIKDDQEKFFRIGISASGDLILEIIDIKQLGQQSSTSNFLTLYDQKSANKALAISDNSKSGMSWGNTTQEQALNEALKNCHISGGTNCKIRRMNSLESSYVSSSNNSTRSSSNNWSHLGTKYVCSELNKGRAYELMLSGHSYLDRDNDGHPCEWNSLSYTSSPTKATTEKRVIKKSNCTWVNAYRRKDGTYVRGHRRCR